MEGIWGELLGSAFTLPGGIRFHPWLGGAGWRTCKRTTSRQNCALRTLRLRHYYKTTNATPKRNPGTPLKNISTNAIQKRALIKCPKTLKQTQKAIASETLGATRPRGNVGRYLAQRRLETVSTASPNAQSFRADNLRNDAKDRSAFARIAGC